MIATSARRVVPAVAALALGVSLTACGSNDDATTNPTGASNDVASLSGELNGAGSSAQEKAQGAWATGFQGLTGGNVTVNYNPVGSGDGRTQFNQGGVDFAGTDSYFKDDEGELSAANKRCGGEDIIEVPAYVSPIAVFFNVPGVKTLNLDSDTIAKIFDGKIAKWNDKAIADQNKDAKLPDLAITPVHRSDDSGTTKNFTDYLGKASKSWKYEAADAFPVKGGLAAEGTSGVVASVSKGKGTIGYADDSALKGLDLGVASLKVGDSYNAPSADGAAKVVELSKAVAGRPATDMAVDIDRTTTEAGAYPAILVSYLVACQHYEDAAKADLVKGYLTYILGDGQQAAADEAGSAPLTKAVADKALAIVAKIAAK
ncbi:phosphate ABC transporter substrate-binding protein PstS [Nocardioides jiangxiensis]|uniref:Phosphate-binding protein n=1 Tax=Nocardioides jiangxiensis TaxID=3064524 RepID=A0ABT9B3J9_9ACTN|nr:phosphate ABC transporter substrate-binding protein PstS [Nocardioides sp. WY-20]MDO7867871.1 phosphate ABC transporter substrate-binding protein PstS [Nocardioides sp. WY-20]